MSILGNYYLQVNASSWTWSDHIKSTAVLDPAGCEMTALSCCYADLPEKVIHDVMRICDWIDVVLLTRMTLNECDELSSAQKLVEHARLQRQDNCCFIRSLHIHTAGVTVYNVQLKFTGLPPGMSNQEWEQ